jgi:GTP cyclohydrolase FolE2
MTLLKKKHVGLTSTCLSTCPSDTEVTENVVVLFDARNHLQIKMYYYSHTITTENQANYATIMLPIGYLAYSSLSQNTTL